MWPFVIGGGALLLLWAAASAATPGIDPLSVPLPRQYRRISSAYGTRPDPIMDPATGLPKRNPDGTLVMKWHRGLDFPAPAGTPIRSITDGRVAEVYLAGYKADGTPKSNGNAVAVRDNDGRVWYYLHMSTAPAVAVGQNVRRGQYLGPVGRTGSATGNHLHLQLYARGAIVDPTSTLVEKGIIA